MECGKRIGNIDHEEGKPQKIGDFREVDIVKSGESQMDGIQDK